MTHTIVNGTRVEMSAKEEAAFEAARAPVLASEQVRVLGEIDTAAEQARQRYITAGEGQAMVYREKADQARGYAEAGYGDTVPGLVQAEADATGDTARAAADAILATRVTWLDKATTVERIRRTAKVAVRAASDVETVWAARDTALSDLEQV